MSTDGHLIRSNRRHDLEGMRFRSVALRWTRG
jgi:hypothetical protein